MKNYLYHTCAICLAIISFSACQPKTNEAGEALKHARELYYGGEYRLAQQKVDSLKKHFPKSLTEIRAGLALLDSARRGENMVIIANCDAAIGEYEIEIADLKKHFVYQRNEKYQDKGVFIPKTIANVGEGSTLLRSGVAEEGWRVYLESVFIGAQKHNKLKLSTSDSSTETLALTEDGHIYRYSNLGTSREILKFSSPYENGTAKFIAENEAKQIKVTLMGQHTTSYNLSAQTKDAIAISYALSRKNHIMDSLKSEREKAEFKMYYLENNKNALQPNSK